MALVLQQTYRSMRYIAQRTLMEVNITSGIFLKLNLFFDNFLGLGIEPRTSGICTASPPCANPHSSDISHIDIIILITHIPLTSFILLPSPPAPPPSSQSHLTFRPFVDAVVLFSFLSVTLGLTRAPCLNMSKTDSPEWFTSSYLIFWQDTNIHIVRKDSMFSKWCLEN